MPEQSTECWEALKAILPSGDHCVLFLEEPADPGRGLKLVTQFPIEQMLCESPRTLSSTDVEIEELGEDDVHEMMSLASLTEPGPFRCRTIQLGVMLAFAKEASWLRWRANVPRSQGVEK
jgi:hypothetical protein